MTGQLLGRYRVEEKIGAGGMGHVYRAHDEQLDRDVALKILPPGTLADEAVRKRFRKEALALGRLSHPNIAMAFDFGNADGLDFLVTEFIPGITLDEKLRGGALPQKTVLELGAQLAGGLEAAHRENIIHRDLKPGNLRLTRDGQLKILDFGLAKLMEPVDESSVTATLDESLSMTGTLPYMAPEQLQGHEGDQRSDIWATGAVLYEMATGKRPFPERQEPQLITSILHDDPIPPTQLNAKISPALESIILKALDKDPDRRYQSAKELRVDLVRVLHEAPLSSPSRSSASAMRIRKAARKRTTWLILAVLVVGVIAGVVARQYYAKVKTSQQRVMAVLPFESVDQDSGLNALGLGLTETLTSKLGQANDNGSLQMVSARELRAENVRTPEEARRTFGTDYVLEGTLQQSGPMMRITCNLVDSRTQRQLASRTITVASSDLFGLQDQVVSEVADMLPSRISDQQRRMLVVHASTQPAAYESYIRGRGYLQEYEKPENIDAAITEFQNAINADPKYAPAYAGLGEAYWTGFDRFNRGNDWLKKASETCQKALTLAGQTSEAHTCLGNVAMSTGDYSTAAKQFQMALDLDKTDDVAMLRLAGAYKKLNKPADAEATYRKAIALRPNYWAPYSWLGAFYEQQGQYTEAEKNFLKVTQLAPENYSGYANLSGIYAYEGRYADAITTAKRSIDLRPNRDAYTNLGAAYFLSHRFAEAAEVLQQGLKMADVDDFLTWGNLGDALYWTPNRRDDARAPYEKAMALLRSGLEVNPNDAISLAYLAEYEAMLGNQGQAMENARRALALAPDDPQVLFCTAYVPIHFGDPRGALANLKKAVAAGASVTVIRDTPDFDPLSKSEEFRKLVGLK